MQTSENMSASMPGSRDLSPHRGERILALGVASLVCSFWGIFGVLPGLAAIPLGIAAWAMGHHDCRAIQAGRMDSSGLKATKAGRKCGMFGLVLPTLLIGEAVFTDPGSFFSFR